VSDSRLSREFGIKLAKALRTWAAEARHDHDLDARYVILDAAEYLRDAADFQINPTLDDTNVDPDQRVN
jgi:hypothetical protein